MYNYYHKYNNFQDMSLYINMVLYLITYMVYHLDIMIQILIIIHQIHNKHIHNHY